MSTSKIHPEKFEIWSKLANVFFFLRRIIVLHHQMMSFLKQVIVSNGYSFKNPKKKAYKVLSKALIFRK